MGDDDGAKSFWKETVGEAPDYARYRCRHDEHEVHLGDMHEAIDQGCDDESDCRSPAA